MLCVKFCITRGRNGFQKLHYKRITRQIFRNINSISTTNYLSHETLNDKNCLKNISRLFSSEQHAVPENPDIFGDIGGHKYEKIELDDSEKELDEFEKNESRIPRSLKPTPGQYVRMIKEHINRRDLNSAMNVLELMKKNRDKPSVYMYNLLLRAFAIQGNLKKCLSLSKAMKVRFLKQNAATYTCLLNACANSPHRESALDALNNLRQEFIQKNIVLNTTNYNTMVKAYGAHQCIVEAFQIVDEMMDKNFYIGETTINALLYASISDKENGLRHSLIIWHLMKRQKIKPSILTYNLLLRAIRDTKFGKFTINDCLVIGKETTKIVLADSVTPDLLSYPPVVSQLAIDSVATSVEKTKEYKQSAPASLSNVVEGEIITSSPAQDVSLNEIHRKNRLILFGGYTGFLERMAKDNVTPDAKTITLLMETVPNSLSIENNLIETARAKKIPLDIDFFNMVMRKRSFRKDFKNAQKILDEIQRSGLSPNVMTWGILALGCRTREEAHALLEGMEATGHTLNTIIAGALIWNGCAHNSFGYILEIMELMYKNRIKPSEHLYTILDNFKKKISDILTKKVKSKHSNSARYKELFAKFNMRYASWQEQFGREKKNNSQNYKKKS